MTFDPTTNRAPFCLLTPEEQKALKEWPHGWEFFSNHAGVWTGVLDDPSWVDTSVYRGKPAPIVHHTYVNVYKNGHTGLPYSTLSVAKAHCGDSVVKTIRVTTIGDEVSVTVLD